MKREERHTSQSEPAVTFTCVTFPSCPGWPWGGGCLQQFSGPWLLVFRTFTSLLLPSKDLKQSKTNNEELWKCRMCPLLRSASLVVRVVKANDRWQNNLMETFLPADVPHYATWRPFKVSCIIPRMQIHRKSAIRGPRSLSGGVKAITASVSRRNPTGTPLRAKHHNVILQFKISCPK